MFPAFPTALKAFAVEIIKANLVMSAHKNCQCLLHLIFSESYQETLVFKRGHQITFLYSDRPFLLCERIIN